MKKIKKFKVKNQPDKEDRQEKKHIRSSKKSLRFQKEDKYRNFKKYLEEE